MSGKEGQPHRRPGGSHEGTRLYPAEKEKQKQRPQPPKPKEIHDTPPEKR